MKLDSSLQKLEIYDHFLTSEFNTQPLNVMDILVDSKDRTWVVTAIDGLMQYVPQNNSFVKYLHNRNLPSSPSGNNYRSIFQDDRDIIWLGTDFVGVNFFEPDKFLFKTIHPFPDRLDERARGVARAITEDKTGNLWMGNHDGVTRYDPIAKKYTTWRNESGKKPALYNNVVRSIHCDDEDNIWIGTASGVNRYNARTRQMEFIPESNLPLAFYNSITQDSDGNIWFCGNLGSGLYWYSTGDRKYHSIFNDPLLKPYAGVTPTSYVMQDSKGRLWISYSRLGVLMVNRQQQKVTQYLASDTPGKSIIGNQVVDIKEDKTGVVWVTSFNGITGIDVEKNRYLSFDNKNGLPGNWCASLAVDDQNRLWVGANGGLTMISADRKRLTRFS
jgi:ligand-binding sensor domain-containing protein